MARIGRFVVPDLPHHVTQRDNRRERVFFGEEDYALYRDLLHEACRGIAVIHAYFPFMRDCAYVPDLPDGASVGAI